MSITEVVLSVLAAAFLVALALFLATFGARRERRIGRDHPSTTPDDATRASWFFVRYAPESRDLDDRSV